MHKDVTDEELLAYASEAQFFLFASEDEVLDIMRETLLAFASRCASKTIERKTADHAQLTQQRDELLAALKKLFSMGTVYPSAIEANHGQDFEEWESEVLALIAKAEGKSDA